MTIYNWLLVIALTYLLISFIRFALGLLPGKWRMNPAPPLGKKWPAVVYSFTGAMSPAKKESAYLHLPTYTAGMIFHMGLFLAILNLLLVLLKIDIQPWVSYVFIAIFLLGSVCGISILIKRINSQMLRKISNPDDYISNVLVTIFQILSALAVYNNSFTNLLLIFSAILIIYIPAGKLRHSFYFFSSRIALGIFYGSRGVWSTKNRMK